MGTALPIGLNRGLGTLKVGDMDEIVGLLEGIATTRAIRRYRDEPVPDEALKDILFAATRAPSGSNRQGFRFIVLRRGETADAAKSLLARAASGVWERKREADRYEQGSGLIADSPKARMARTMREYVDNFERVPVLILACLVRHRDANLLEGASVYPACQNLLLAARATGYGGVLTGFHKSVEAELAKLLGLPENVVIAATITLGRPVGRHGPVRRVPLSTVVYEDAWGQSAEWAVDPAETRFTAPGPAV
jgi:nitroreductase